MALGRHCDKESGQYGRTDNSCRDDHCHAGSPEENATHGMHHVACGRVGEDLNDIVGHAPSSATLFQPVKVVWRPRQHFARLESVTPPVY
jgi:hypothetical protein